MPAYVVISPVKDEEKFIEATLQSMVAQTVKPVRWIVVDDGSGDRTPDMVEAYTRQHAWITLVRLPRRKERGAGSPVVRAFHAGWEMVEQGTFDFVVKMDCDLRLPATYFEQLLEKFHNDPGLGITSGAYVEETENGWRRVAMPEYHAAGATKVIRARCFEEIGGFVASRGWDTVDEIRARTRGWRTCHFPELTFEHLKPEGSSRGALYTSRLHGEVYYLTGGPAAFFLFKALHRMVFGRPPLVAGMMLLAGYLKPMVLGRQRLVTKAEARHYQRMMNQRMWTGFMETTRRFGLKLNSRRAI